MKRYSLLIIGILAIHVAYSQRWTYAPAIHPRDINCLKIFNHDTIVVAGGWLIVNPFQTAVSQAVFRSANSGLGWGVSLDAAGGWIKSIDFTDAQNGIAVGAEGVIMNTPDGGNNWSFYIPPVSRDFNKIFFINTQNMVIVGGEPTDSVPGGIQTVLRTINGGQTWYTVRDQPGFQLKSVYFPTSALGYAVGDSGTILKSTNAGTSWIPVASPIQRDFNAIWFTDANNGFIVGGNLKNDSIRTILQTTNGGSTWTILEDQLGGWLNDITFIDADTGYAVGDRATVLKTIDGGQTWTQQVIPGTLGDEYFNAVSFLSWNYGFVVGKWGVQYIYNDDGTPEVYTTGAAVNDTTQITLNGLVNTHGYTAVYSARFSNDNFSTTQFETPYPGDVRSNTLYPVSVGVLYDWLTPNTTYQYLIKAWTLGGTAYGDTLSFFTGTAGSEIKTLPASNITDTSITLNGTIRGFSMPMNLFFEYDTTPSFGNQIAATPAVVNDTALRAVAANLQGLQPLTFYFYRLKGVSGTSNYYGDTYSFYTLGNAYISLETHPASTVSDSAATLNGFIEGFKFPVTVSFDYSPNNFDFNFSAYPPNSNYNDSLPHSITAFATSLHPGTLYYFRIKAQTSFATYFGDTVAFYTGAPVLHTLTATNVTWTGAQFNGSVARFAVPVDLSFQYGADTTLSNEVIATPVSVNDTFAHDVSAVVSGGLQDNSLYYYRIKAETANGVKFYGERKQVFTGNSIPNWDFQYWQQDTFPLLNDWNLAGEQYERLPGRSGNYALKVTGPTIALLGVFVADRQFSNVTGDFPAFTGGVPFTARPDSISVYLNKSIAPADSGTIFVILYRDSIAVAYNPIFITGNSGGQFVKHTFPLTYISPLAPEYLSLGFISLLPGSKSHIPDSRNFLVIDDISFTPNVTDNYNGGFENWFDYPHNSLLGWTYLNHAFVNESNINDTLFVSQGIFNPPDDYAVELRTVPTYGNWTASELSNKTALIGDRGGFPIHARHQVLNGYYKWFPANGDTLMIQVQMFSHGQEICRQQFFQADSVKEFTPFEVPITYSDNFAIPDTALISINTASRVATGASRAVIDKLSFDGFTDVKEINSPAQNHSASIKVFPNPTSSFITFQLEKEMDGMFEIFDFRGSLVYADNFKGDRKEVDATDFPKGIYMLRVTQKDRTLLNKFMVIR